MRPCAVSSTAFSAGPKNKSRSKAAAGEPTAALLLYAFTHRRLRREKWIRTGSTSESAGRPGSSQTADFFEQASMDWRRLYHFAFCAINSGPYTSAKPPNAEIQAKPANSISATDPLKAATILVTAAAKMAA